MVDVVYEMKHILKLHHEYLFVYLKINNERYLINITGNTPGNNVVSVHWF